MKPKTKLQWKVAELSSKLRPFSEKQIQWGIENCHSKFVIRSRKTLTCLECGHSWKEETPSDELLTSIDNGCTCPECGEKLELRQYKRSFAESVYYGIMTTVDDMQLIRIMVLKKWMQKGEKPSFSQHEVQQYWIDQSGKMTVMAKKVNGMSRYYDEWILDSEMEIREGYGGYKWYSRIAIEPFKYYPSKKVLPIIKRNGYKGNSHNFTLQYFFSLILRSEKAETLLKAGQVSLLQRMNYPEKVEKYWSSIKICIRRGYIVHDAQTWLDHLVLLESMGKDLHSPKYIRPADLKKEHQRYIDKQAAIRRKQKLEELRQQIDEAQVVYEQKKKDFFGIQFSDGQIDIKVLDHVGEFMTEGDILHHCVFSGKYYEKDESLVMSALVDNKPVETIELSLKEMKILQCRGLHNKPTEYHDKIESLVQNNLTHIRKAAQRQAQLL